MKRFSCWKGSAEVASYLKQSCLRQTQWDLRWKPVSGSTETDLSRWLQQEPCLGRTPRAIFASRQLYGRGQNNRLWNSPKGGIWLSAAIPIDNTKKLKTSALFGLAVAVGMVQRLAKSQVPVSIKWPNDLIVGKRKLAGLLPRVVLRGDLFRLARVGIGLNVLNRVPSEGIALTDIFYQSNISIAFWSAEVLIAIDKAISLLDNPELLVSEAELLLWSRTVKEPLTEQLWDIEGIDLNGFLKVRRGKEERIWSRWD